MPAAAAPLGIRTVNHAGLPIGPSTRSAARDVDRRVRLRAQHTRVRAAATAAVEQPRESDARHRPRLPRPPAAIADSATVAVRTAALPARGIGESHRGAALIALATPELDALLHRD